MHFALPRQWRDPHPRLCGLLHEEAPQHRGQQPPGARGPHQHCPGRGQPPGQVNASSIRQWGRRGRGPHTGPPGVEIADL